jgi:Uncharacterized protein conserved in bacteria (DUF2330)
MAPMRPPSIAAGLVLLATAALARPAGACAPAPPPGLRVDIAEESALIVWDAAAHREHFIRRAAFRTEAKDFGFLVPTPDKPDLAEVSDAVFASLDDAIRPDVVHERETGVEPTLLCGFFMMSRGAMTAPAPVAAVRVLGEQRVAGYDAVVLEADSAGALAGWLQDHGYAQRPELSDWLAPYVAAKWKLTAFKIAAGSTGPVESAAVRMSFTTDRPFFPYREPSDQRENRPASAPSSERLLRVFFVGSERADGTIGAEHAPWPGRAVWSDRLDAQRLALLPKGLAPENAWLTAFEDRASPRPGTDDLFFAPGKERGPVKPPPVVEMIPNKIPLPLDLVAGGALLCAYLWRRAKRGGAKPTG